MTKKKQKKQNPASFSLLLRLFDEKNWSKIAVPHVKILHQYSHPVFVLNYACFFLIAFDFMMIPSNTVAFQKKTPKIKTGRKKKITNLQSIGDGQSHKATFDRVTTNNSKQPGKEDDQIAEKLQTQGKPPEWTYSITLSLWCKLDTVKSSYGWRFER